MDITRKDIDALNAVVTINVTKEDYAVKVENILTDYKKNAAVPGFRKGHVPMGMIKKQYGKAVLIDEVNKLLQESLNKYLNEEKLEVLGNPLPKPQDNLDWEGESFVFDFELGIAPKFNVDFKVDKSVVKYDIFADDTMIDSQVENIQKQYGKLVSQEEVAEGTQVTAVFKNEEQAIETNFTFEVEKLADEALKVVLGKKKDDSVALSTKNLFKESNDLVSALKVSEEVANELDVEVELTVSEVNLRELADLDQELFDKVFGEGKVSSVSELKDKIKEDAEKQFSQQSDQKFLNDVTEFLVSNTKFDLPVEFLQKWIQTSGEQVISEEQAREEYEKSEKGLRYQLIEGKIATENNLQISFEELKSFALEMIKAQMAQFGQLNPSEKELEDIASRILSNQEEVKRLNDQLMSKKLLDLYKAEVEADSKSISYDDFVKEFYS